MASKIATMPALSSPPSTVVRSVRTMSPSTTRWIFSAGPTVSMWAERRKGGAPALVPVKRARRFPVSPPTFSPASSTSTEAPMPLRMLSSRRAMAPSRRDRLEIAGQLEELVLHPAPASIMRAPCGGDA